MRQGRLGARSGAAPGGHADVGPDLPALVREAGLDGAPAGTGFAVQLASGLILAASPESERVLGLTLAQMQGRSSTDPRWSCVDAQGRFVPGEEHPAMRAVRTGRPVRRCVLGVYRPGSDRPGRHVWLDVDAVPLLDADGRAPWAVVTAFTPVAGDRLAALELHESERLHRMIAERTSDMVAWQLADSTFLWVSPASTTVLGRHPDELVGTRGLDLLHPDDLPRTVDAARAGAPLRLRLRHRDGGYRWVETTSRRVPDPAGGEDQVITAFRDVTASAAAEQQRDSAIALFETAMDTATIGVGLRQLDGVLTRVNPALCTILGRPAGEIVGHRLGEFAASPNPAAELGRRQVVEGQLGSHEVDREFRRPDGTTVWCTRTLVRLPPVDGVAHLLVQLQDITARKDAAAELARVAVTDPLTGLPNRAVLTDRLTQSLAHARRSATRVGVLFIDLDHFKAVNDTYGHDVGDALLHEVGQRLRGVVREGDTVVRLGGDEFVVSRDGLAHVVELDDLADLVCAALAEPFHLDGHVVTVSASVGTVTGQAGTARDLLTRADAAMYGAKRGGRGRVQAHTAASEVAATERQALQAELELAIDGGQLVLHHQAIVDTAGTAGPRVVAREALVRWDHPVRGLLGPDLFVDVADLSSLTTHLGGWVLRRACAEAPAAGTTSVHVNVSARHLAHSGFTDHVRAVLAETGLAPHRLCLEITETLVLAASSSTLRSAAALTELGVRLALDDFGTGQSSIATLHQLPITTIKIDRSHVGALHVRSTAALVDGVLRLADALGLDVVAEGVETTEQATWLRNHGCTTHQGFLYARPVPAAPTRPGPLGA